MSNTSYVVVIPRMVCGPFRTRAAAQVRLEALASELQEVAEILPMWRDNHTPELESAIRIAEGEDNG